MTTLKATASMISAVRAVRPMERRAAMVVAEAAFRGALQRLTQFGDFSAEQNQDMAGEAAAAEVAFRFA